ncbi:MAG: branched-chain amino acid transport system substrate-binding protein [Thermoleophilaceae bacterium]|nr:branched-chain amino acid transport system substrate-binding protein [Thermoleophilaceae bacterium]
MRRRRQLLPVCLVVCWCIVLFAGCGNGGDSKDSKGSATDSQSSGEKTTKTFKLGLAGPYTGPVAKTGEEFRAAMELALEARNYQVGEYKIEPVWVDEASDPEKAANATEQAIVSEGIGAGCLNWHSSDAVAMMDVVAKHKIPWFFGIGGTDLVNEKFHRDQDKLGYWMAKGWPVIGKLNAAYADAVVEAASNGTISPGSKSVALWSEDTDLGRSWTDEVEKRFKEQGWEIKAKEFFPIDATDHYPMLTKFKSLDVSVVAGAGSAPDSMSSLIKQSQEVGLNALMIADGLGWVGEWYKLTGPASDYVLDMIPQWASPEAKEFKEEFTDRFGFEPSAAAGGLVYDWTTFCLDVLERTLEKYGDLTSENIYKVGREEVWTGKLTFSDGIIMDEYKFDAESIPDPVVGPGNFIIPVIQYFNGKPEIVYPPDVKTADLKMRGS